MSSIIQFYNSKKKCISLQLDDYVITITQHLKHYEDIYKRIFDQQWKKKLRYFVDQEILSIQPQTSLHYIFLTTYFKYQNEVIVVFYLQVFDPCR